MKGLAKESEESACVPHRQQCGDGQREGGWGLGGSGQRRGAGSGQSGDICNSVNNKNKGKKILVAHWLKIAVVHGSQTSCRPSSWPSSVHTPVCCSSFSQRNNSSLSDELLSFCFY